MKTHYRLYNEHTGLYGVEEYDTPEEAFTASLRAGAVIVVKIEEVNPTNPF